MDLLNERLQQLEMLKASSEIVPKRPKESKKDCRVFVGSRTRRPQVSHTTQGPTKLKDNMNQESDAQLHVETQKQLEHHLCENACLPQAKAICVKEGASAENDVQITVAFNAQCKPNMMRPGIILLWTNLMTFNTWIENHQYWPGARALQTCVSHKSLALELVQASKNWAGFGLPQDFPNRGTCKAKQRQPGWWWCQLYQHRAK